MKPEINICGDIKDYCIACLDKSTNMHDLNEDVERRRLFTSLFNIELSNYRKYPQFLCCMCDIKLNVVYNFQQSVRKCLEILQEYNEPFKEEQNEKDDILQAIKNKTAKADSEDEVQSPKERLAQRIDSSKIQPISAELVNNAIEEFRSKLAEKKVCPLCGFIAANRRAISSHMAIFHKDKKPNWCLECNHIFENYEEHKQMHSSKYRCPFCEKEANVSHYIEHLQSHAGIFECECCSKTFKSAAWLKKHTRIHTNEKPYVCPNCSKGFIQMSSLRYHVATHGKFSCHNCKRRYKNEIGLAQHECSSENLLVPSEILIKNDDGKADGEIEEKLIIKASGLMDCTELQNFCQECNKRVKSLNQHINKYHNATNVEKTMVKEVQCEFCQRTYTNLYKLKIHVRTHTGERPYKCKYCDKRTINRSRLKDHERTHTKEKPYICNICGKGLSQASALRTHMKRHTGRPEVCELCNKRFCRKSELRLHLSKHMGEKPFLCTECGKTFAQKSHLTEHMAGHGEARPFQCPCCQKAFKKKILLKEHVKLHQGHKPFKCPSCSYACYKAYRLQQHMKQHSGDLYESIEQSQVVDEADCVKSIENNLLLG